MAKTKMLKDSFKEDVINLISRDAAIKAMLNEQQDDIKAYGCPIPECFDGDRASRVLMQLPYIDADMSEYSDRLWKLAYERGKTEGIVRCKDCKHYNAGFECLIEGYGIEKNPNWFCADGERRLDDGKE